MPLPPLFTCSRLSERAAELSCRSATELPVVLRRSGVCKASAQCRASASCRASARRAYGTQCVCDKWWDGAQCEQRSLLLVLFILLCVLIIIIASLGIFGAPDCLVSAYVNWRIAHELRAEQMQDLPESSEIHEVKSVPAAPVKSCMICSCSYDMICKHCLARDIEQKVMAVAVVVAVAMNGEEGQYGASCDAV